MITIMPHEAPRDSSSCRPTISSIWRLYPGIGPVRKRDPSGNIGQAQPTPTLAPIRLEPRLLRPVHNPRHRHTLTRVARRADTLIATPPNDICLAVWQCDHIHVGSVDVVCLVVAVGLLHRVAVLIDIRAGNDGVIWTTQVYPHKQSVTVDPQSTSNDGVLVTLPSPSGRPIMIATTFNQKMSPKRERNVAEKRLGTRTFVPSHGRFFPGFEIFAAHNMLRETRAPGLSLHLRPKVTPRISRKEPQNGLKRLQMHPRTSPKRPKGTRSEPK